MRIVDLTHPMSDAMPMIPGMAEPQFEDIARWESDGYRMSQYTPLNHTGTHVDAPGRISRGAATRWTRSEARDGSSPTR